MNRIYFIFSFFLAIIIIAYAIIKQKLEELSLSVVNIKFKRFTTKEISGTLFLLIKNPFGKVEVSNIKLNLYVNGFFISPIEQTDKSKIELLPDNNLLAKVDFFILPKKLLTIESIIASLINIGKNTYTIEGTITIKKWFITANIPINYTSTFKEE